MLLNMNQSYGWQRFYEAAVLETNRSSLLRRIQAAQAAIDARKEQLKPAHNGNSNGNSQEEEQAIADALAGLNILRDEVS